MFGEFPHGISLYERGRITIIVDYCPSVPVQGGQAIPLYLEAILVMLSSLSTALQQGKEFINVIWWVQ